MTDDESTFAEAYCIQTPRTPHEEIPPERLNSKGKYIFSIVHGELFDIGIRRRIRPFYSWTQVGPVSRIFNSYKSPRVITIKPSDRAEAPDNITDDELDIAEPTPRQLKRLEKILRGEK